MYRAVTRNIEVVVTPRFVADRSSPDNNYFFWAYTIAITNNGEDTVQLKTRHWSDRIVQHESRVIENFLKLSRGLAGAVQPGVS